MRSPSSVTIRGVGLALTNELPPGSWRCLEEHLGPFSCKKIISLCIRDGGRLGVSFLINVRLTVPSLIQRTYNSSHITVILFFKNSENNIGHLVASVVKTFYAFYDYSFHSIHQMLESSLFLNVRDILNIVIIIFLIGNITFRLCYRNIICLIVLFNNLPFDILDILVLSHPN